ncbi:DUF2062 domain-containing protein [Qipengyuania mesophila]|uniref:DUF2062 domain-containing protein n=1 Tax=Erythrobacteraceae TaxID=335929 RepID=UPI003517F9B2
MNQRSDSLHKPTARSAVWGYIRKYTDREWLAQNRVLKPIAHRFLSPELWRFTRRNVPRGVALGLFAGFVIPVGQIFLALVLAFTVRANVPIASGVTLVTNPLTFPFWIWAANRVGHKVLSFAPDTGEAILQNDSVMSLGGLFQAAGATVLGFFLFATLFPPIGYFITKWVWRFAMGRRRKKRLSRGNLARQQVALDYRIEDEVSQDEGSQDESSRESAS